MNEISFAHILFATTVPGKPFDKLKVVSSAKRGIKRPAVPAPS